MIKLIRYHLPPNVKHVLAPQNDFGMPKITWSNHKSFGIWWDPPSPYGEKFPKNPVFFFWHAPLWNLCCVRKSEYIFWIFAKKNNHNFMRCKNTRECLCKYLMRSYHNITLGKKYRKYRVTFLEHECIAKEFSNIVGIFVWKITAILINARNKLHEYAQ